MPPFHSSTRFDATVNTPLDFGQIVRARNDLAHLGSAPNPGSLFHARLTNEVSSATATRGTSVNAVLTEPLFSSHHHLLLPANSRLVGEVLEAKPARRLHHNGDLRVVFERIEAPDGTGQAMKGNLEGMEVDRAANLRLDEEGGAQATDNKTRYLSSGFAVLLAAAASHADNERGATDVTGDPGVRAGAGASGYGFAGSLISLAAQIATTLYCFRRVRSRLLDLRKFSLWRQGRAVAQAHSHGDWVRSVSSGARLSNGEPAVPPIGFSRPALTLTAL